ncbi:MAG: hypothetical protein WC848_03135 [Parcubacteria group bacterium]|jgi:hypothetical protein
MSSEKKIIFALVILLFFSFCFLSYFEKKQLQPSDAGWEIYFEDPQSDNLTFIIENNTKTKKIHWKEMAGESNVIIKEADILVVSGQKSTIPLLNESDGEKITIEVSDELGGKKEIHKRFN